MVVSDRFTICNSPFTLDWAFTVVGKHSRMPATRREIALYSKAVLNEYGIVKVWLEQAVTANYGFNGNTANLSNICVIRI